MPNQSTATYTQYSLDDYLAEACERIGMRGDQINSDVIASAERSANLMLAAWAADGFRQFDMNLSVFNVGPGSTNQQDNGSGVIPGSAFAAGALQIFSSVIRVGAGTTPNPYYDIPMVRISRYDYEQIPAKANTGRPDRFFWDTLGTAVSGSQDSQGNSITGQRYMQVWPWPNTAYTIRAWCICRPQDVGGLVNTPDIGYEWIEAFASGLAARMALKWAPSLYQMLKQEAGGPDMPPNPATGYAGGAYLVAKRGERERGPTRLRLDSRTRESPR